ncbi:alpha,alpha-trehalase, partial [Tremellales sp. Uapishka_1]
MLYLLLPLLLTAAHAQNTTTGSSLSATPVSTSVPSPTSPLNSSVIGQGLYPPLQAWCNRGRNDTFCPGVLLQDVELSGIYADSKTFPDKPTVNPLNETLAAFAALPANVTVGEIETFVEANFVGVILSRLSLADVSDPLQKGEGLELTQIELQGFVANPAILNHITDPVFKGWVSIVNGYWQLLIRYLSSSPIFSYADLTSETNQSALCNATECESSLIPLNHTIVVPGGRYREIYYWDSRWILEGLLKSELYTYAEDLLENFMDLIDAYGFLPNGGRKYYLNRSQPPVFIQMLDAYIKATGNTTILERALPIASGYVEDFTTAMGASPALNESQRADLYSELATGAETGWDYSSRWCKQPLLNLTDNNPALRTLNTRAIIPVDLNSLLAGDHALLANLYQLYLNTTSNSTLTANYTSMVTYHQSVATNLSAAILDLHWSPSKSYFYDFNMTANARSDIFTPAGLFPLWQNITPAAVVGNETEALRVVSGVRYLLGRYAGIPSVATLLLTGLNWDFPNSWPPHVFTSIKAFETLSRAVPNMTVLANLTIPFSSVVPGQLGLNETDLQPQPSSTIGNSTLYTQEAAGKTWSSGLSIEYANSGVLFLFNVTDPDAAGGGGEYTVQTGFGWTNGVVLWLAGEFGADLPSPSCPLIPIIETNGTMSNTTTNSTLFTGYRIPQ